MRTGFIGCGKIAHFHARALKALGEEITCVSYRANRENAENFSRTFGIKRIFSDWEEMIASENPDALWVLADWEAIDELLLPVLKYDKPVFFEKPVALSSEKIEKAISDYPSHTASVQVGYNRRFYSVVGRLKEELSGKRVIAAEVFIPESVSLTDKKLIRYRALQNSSHIIDLLYHIFDDFNPVVRYVTNMSEAGHETPGFTAMLDSSGGFGVYISSVFNSPINTSIRIYTDDQTIYELKPLEKMGVYRGFEIIEPNDKQPIRLYNPGVISEIFEPADKFKPGFIEQARAFIDRTCKNNNEGLPNLNSSLRVTRLIEELTGSKNDRNG
jgi:predicted dehydrogenase